MKMLCVAVDLLKCTYSGCYFLGLVFDSYCFAQKAKNESKQNYVFFC